MVKWPQERTESCNDPPWSLRSELAHPKQWAEEECSASIAGVPLLQEQMPDDLRRRWCNNNRNKVHNKYNALESSLNHPQTIPLPPVHGKIVFHETSPWWQKGWGLLIQGKSFNFSKLQSMCHLGITVPTPEGYMRDQRIYVCRNVKHSIIQ